LGQADPQNILDRFHIVAKMNEALHDVRAVEARRLYSAAVIGLGLGMFSQART
jgi:Transposase